MVGFGEQEVSIIWREVNGLVPTMSRLGRSMGPCTNENINVVINSGTYEKNTTHTVNVLINICDALDPC